MSVSWSLGGSCDRWNSFTRGPIVLGCRLASAGYGHRPRTVRAAVPPHARARRRRGGRGERTLIAGILEDLDGDAPLGDGRAMPEPQTLAESLEQYEAAVPEDERLDALHRLFYGFY